MRQKSNRDHLHVVDKFERSRHTRNQLDRLQYKRDRKQVVMNSVGVECIGFGGRTRDERYEKGPISCAGQPTYRSTRQNKERKQTKAKLTVHDIKDDVKHSLDRDCDPQEVGADEASDTAHPLLLDTHVVNEAVLACSLPEGSILLDDFGIDIARRHGDDDDVEEESEHHLRATN